MSAWNTSPVDEGIDKLELSGGLTVDTNILKVKNNGIGFIDEFDGSAVSAKWTYSSGTKVENGRLYLPFNGTGDGYGKRHVTFQLTDAMRLIGLTFIVNDIHYDDVNNIQFMIGFGRDYTNLYNSGYWWYINSGTGGNIRFFANGNYPFDDIVRNGLSFSLKFVVEENFICNCFYKLNGETSWTFAHSVQLYNDADNDLFDTKCFSWQGYYDAVQDMSIGSIEIYNTTSETAELPITEAYTALLPAKLAKVLTIQPNIAIAGNGGNVNLLVQHKSDEDETWVSLTDIPNEWTDLGTIDGTAITVPDYFSRTNDKFRYKLLYSGDGLQSYPEIDKVTFTWESDVTAPSEPIITTAISTSESILTILFADLLPDVYAIIFELNINGAGSLPFSERGKIESGYGYMRFVGSKTEIEQQAERNGLVTSIKGLQEGDIVIITAFARDKVGNISAGKTKSITMSGAQYVRVPVENYKVVWGEDKDWNVRWQ